MNLFYFVDNKLGGVSSLNYNLASHAPATGTNQVVIHITAKEERMTRVNLVYPDSQNVDFVYSLNDNAYSVARRLRRLLPAEPGGLVTNYQFEMQMLDHHPVPQTVYQLVHDEYNVGVAVKYGHVADVFIAHNRFIFERLRELLPDRKQDIFFLKHGVPIPSFYREHSLNQKEGLRPLKLLFLGRMDLRKGIDDLPVIDDLLASSGIAVEWTCIGNGPALEALKSKWAKKGVGFISPSKNEEVLKIASEHDIFVLPTKFEGSPVSLLETMSVGLVPVISDLPGGIREVVNEQTGFRVTVDDNEGFAAAIARLHNDRDLLQKLSAGCREEIMKNYDIRQTAAAYHELFRQYAARFSPKRLKKLKIGARLDQPWLPSFIKRSIRLAFEKTPSPGKK
jgi:glycosyltransferase involved in cell wall biosynthesis